MPTLVRQRTLLMQLRPFDWGSSSTRQPSVAGIITCLRTVYREAEQTESAGVPLGSTALQI